MPVQHSYDIIAYTYNCDYYCPDCVADVPEDEKDPIFADSSSDFEKDGLYCAECGEEIVEPKEEEEEEEEEEY